MIEPTTASLGHAGPAQSELLVHFCGRPPGTRPTPRLDAEIAALSAPERLDRILAASQLLAFPPFGANDDQPAVCFSESPDDHLVHLLRDRHWQPWGLIVSRKWVYEQGGGPVWYARDDLYKTRTTEQNPWLVRFDATTNAERWADWTHEREWRVPTGCLDLADPEAVVAILLGEPGWMPTSITREVPDGWLYNAVTGEICDPMDPNAVEGFDTVTVPPAAWETAARWYWDPATVSITKKPPLGPSTE